MLAIRTADSGWLAVPSLLARLRDLAVAVGASEQAHAAALTDLRAAVDEGRRLDVDARFADYDDARARVDVLAELLAKDVRALGLLDCDDGNPCTGTTTP